MDRKGTKAGRARKSESKLYKKDSKSSLYAIEGPVKRVFKRAMVNNITYCRGEKGLCKDHQL